MGRNDVQTQKSLKRDKRTQKIFMALFVLIGILFVLVGLALFYLDAFGGTTTKSWLLDAAIVSIGLLLLFYFIPWARGRFSRYAKGWEDRFKGSGKEP